MIFDVATRAIGKIFRKISDRKLSPPNRREADSVAEIKEWFSEVPRLETDRCLPSEKEWLDNINSLRELVLCGDPREFLRWDVIKRTMLVENAPFVRTELKYLKGRPDWKTRWSLAVRETPVGNPVPYWLCSNSSENLLHHAYHLAQFEEKSSLTIGQMDYIFEFGGGYGSFCRLCHNLGFKGKYIIFDFPAFSKLQQYFLKSIGVQVFSVEAFETEKSGAFIVSDVKQLATMLSRIKEADRSMFIATWSISETPIEFRKTILALIPMFNSFLIGYQERFGEADNIEYFKEWQESRKDMEWHNWEIEHLRQSFYLVGKNKGNR